MVEILKTNVQTPCDAQILLKSIHDLFKNYQCNFDLEDCDRILRIETKDNKIEADLLIKILNKHGYVGEILDDVF